MGTKIKIDKKVKCEFKQLFEKRLEEKSLTDRGCETNVDNDEEWFYMQAGDTRYNECFHYEVIDGGVEFHIEESQYFSDDDCKSAQKYFSTQDDFLELFKFKNERCNTIGGYRARYKYNKKITPENLFTIFFELPEKLDPIINKYVESISKTK